MNTDVELTVINRDSITESITTNNDLQLLTTKILENPKSLINLTITNESSNVYSSEVVNNLASAITTCNSLENLEIANFQQFLGFGLYEIIRAITALVKLKRLSFEGTFLGVDGVELLSEVVRKSTVVCLILKNSAILPDESYYRLGRMLSKNTYLEKMDLSHNPISQGFFNPNTGDIVKRNIKKNKRAPLREFICDYPATCLENENLYRELMVKVFPVCQWGRDFTKPDLRDVDKNIKEIESNNREYIQSYNKSTESLKEAKRYISERLLLKVTSLESFEKAITKIAARDNLVEIIIYAESPLGIPLEITRSFINALRACQRLQRLSIQHFDNAFGESICEIMFALRWLTALTHLDLSYTLVGKYGFAKLIKFLQTNPPLRKLNVTHCGLYAWGTYAYLGGTLAKSNLNLQSITISKNFINQERINDLKEEFKNRNILLFCELEKSWLDSLKFLKYFIKQIPWDKSNIKEELPASNEENSVYDKVCQANMDLQRFLWEKYQPLKPKENVKKKLKDKIEHGFILFKPSVLSTDKAKVLNTKNTQSEKPILNEESPLMTNHVTAYGTFTLSL